jgi:acyl carrier protein
LQFVFLSNRVIEDITPARHNLQDYTIDHIGRFSVVVNIEETLHVNIKDPAYYLVRECCGNVVKEVVAILAVETFKPGVF